MFLDCQMELQFTDSVSDFKGHNMPLTRVLVVFVDPILPCSRLLLPLSPVFTRLADDLTLTDVLHQQNPPLGPQHQTHPDQP